MINELFSYFSQIRKLDISYEFSVGDNSYEISVCLHGKKIKNKRYLIYSAYMWAVPCENWLWVYADSEGPGQTAQICPV